MEGSTANLCLLIRKEYVTHNLGSRFSAPQIHIAPLNSLLRGSALTLSVFPKKLLKVKHPAHALGQDQTAHASEK